MTDWRTRPQGGYSLVEIGIVLVAISFVVTGAVWPFAERYRTEQHEDTAEYMRAMQSAIIAYANTHRTPGVAVVFTDNGTPPTFAQIEIPSGRPVLPCPDLNGDGLEDRNQVITGGATVTVTYGPPGSGTNRTLVVSLDNVPGRCMDDKGNIPWRTLGTQPFDHWGQIYTYWVDYNFTSGVFGFDQTTRGNSVFKHMVLRMSNRTGYTYPLSSYTIPLAVSRTAGGGFAFDASRGSRRTYVHNGAVLSQVDTPLPSSTTAPLGLNRFADDRLALVAGDFFHSKADYYRSLTEKRFLNRPDGQEVDVYEFRGIQSELDYFLEAIPTILAVPPVIADGIAFALVSHGPNGLGGITYDNYPTSTGDVSCRSFATYDASTTEHYFEILNARRTTPCQMGLLTGQGNCGNLGLSASCGRRNATNGLFFIAPRTGAVSTKVFDDVVTWMHPTELVTALTERGILPVPVPPVADPGEQYLVDNTTYLR